VLRDFLWGKEGYVHEDAYGTPICQIGAIFGHLTATHSAWVAEAARFGSG